MELFPALITTPFIIAREQSRLDKADAELVGLWKSDKAHSFANIVETKVDEGVEGMNSGNHDDDDHTNRPNSMNPNNKRYQNGTRKNCDGEKGTTPETNALGADKKKDKKGKRNNQKANKRRKVNRDVRFSTDPRTTIANPNPYAGDKKKKSSRNTKRDWRESPV